MGNTIRFVATVNFATAFFLALFYFTLVSAVRIPRRELSAGLLYIGLGWLANAAYMLTEKYMPLNALAQSLRPTHAVALLYTLSSLQNLATQHGALRIIGGRLPTFILRWRLHSFLFVAITLTTFFVARPDSKELLPGLTLYNILTLGLLALAFRDVFGKVYSSPQIQRWLIIAPLYFYALAQVVYGFRQMTPADQGIPHAESPDASPESTSLLIAFTIGAAVKFAHLAGLVIFYTRRLRAAGDIEVEQQALEHSRRYCEEMAHELVTPTTELLLRIDEVRHALRTRGDVQTSLGQVTAVGGRINIIANAAHEHLAMRHDKPRVLGVMQPINANVWCHAAVMSVRSTRRERIFIRDQYSGNIFLIAQPERFVQLMVILLTNCYDAFYALQGGLFHGGRTVYSGSTLSRLGETSGQIYIRTFGEQKDERKVVGIEVVDEFGGVPAEVLATLGRARTSTKGEGRGLGLLIAREIVGDFGGNMDFDSVQGGFKASLRFPYTEERPRLRR